MEHHCKETNGAGVRENFVAIGAMTLTHWSVLGLTALIVGSLNYHRWDNFESVVPIILSAHRYWLHGHFPHWSHFQHLGEPLLANASAGALYFPYTLVTALIECFSLDPKHFGLLVVLSHLPILSAGWFLFFRAVGIQKHLGAVFAFALGSGAALTCFAMVWIFTVPSLTWLPWALLAAMRLLEGTHAVRWLVIFAIALAAEAANSHPQMTAYTWIFVLLFSVGYSVAVLGRARAMTRLLVPGVLAFMISAPALLPIYSLLKHTSRSGPVSVFEFTNLGASWSTSMLSFVLPFFPSFDDILHSRYSWYYYFGPWVMPALCVGLWSLFEVGRSTKNSSKEQATIARLKRLFVVLSAIALIFMMCAAGGHSILYRLSYRIPVWSSFRFPFRAIPWGAAAATVAAIIGLELYFRGFTKSRRSRMVATIFLLLAFFIVLHFRKPDIFSSPMKFSIAFLSIVTIPVVLWLNRRTWPVLACLVFLAATATTVFCHTLDFKTYQEKAGSVGVQELGIDPRFRVLPMTDGSNRRNFQALSLSQSAMVNQYYSVTGCSTPMVPVWKTRWLPANAEGILSEKTYRTLLPSHWLRSLNVRYVLADRDDLGSLRILTRTGAYHLAHQYANTLVFENQGALLRAYFSDVVYPFDESELIKGLIKNQASSRSAYVETWEKVWKAPQGTVRNIDWTDPNSVRIDVDAPQGGFLVVSQLYYPEWKAYVDGEPAKVYRTNGLIQGLSIPGGSRRVVMVFRTPGFFMGFMIALFGLFFIPAIWKRCLTHRDASEEEVKENS